MKKSNIFHPSMGGGGAILLLSLLLFACGKKESTSNYIRLAWWGNTVRDERTIKAVELYQSQNPGVTIETETVGWAGYWDKMNTQAAAGDLPDLMQHDWAYIAQWANRNQLLDLDPFVKDGTIDVSKIPETTLSAGRINGKLYALSLGTNAYGFTYDPAVLEKAGVKIDSVNWTFKDFENTALTIYQKTGVKTLPFTPTSPYNVIEYMIRETGKPFYAADGKSLGFTDTTQIKEFFDIQLRLLDAGALYSPEESYITTTMEEGPFAKGLTWNEYVYSNQLIAQQAANGRPIAEALIPHINGSRQRLGVYLKPSQFIAITAQSKNPALAAKVLNFFVNSKEANAILLAERGVPAPTDIRDYLYTLVDPSNKMAFDYVTLVSDNSSAIDPPDPAPAGEVMAFIRDLTLQVLTKKVSSADALTQFMTGCNKILSGN